MDKIDILLKAVLELKEEMTILGYKIDNLESKVDKLDLVQDDLWDDDDSSSYNEPTTKVESDEYDRCLSEMEKALEKTIDALQEEETEASSSKEDGDEPQSTDEPSPEEYEPTIEDPSENDPFEEQENGMSSEELCKEIQAGSKEIFHNNKVDIDKLKESISTSSKPVSESALAAIEEIKKKQAELEKKENSIQYDINNHIGMKL